MTFHNSVTVTLKGGNGERSHLERERDLSTDIAVVFQGRDGPFRVRFLDQGSRQGRASPGPAALGSPFFAGPGSPGPPGPRCSQPCRVRASPRAMKDFKWAHSSDSDP